MISVSEIEEKAKYILSELPGKGMNEVLLKPWVTFYDNLYGPVVVLHYLNGYYELNVCLNTDIKTSNSNHKINNSTISAKVSVYLTEEPFCDLDGVYMTGDVLLDTGCTPTYIQKDNKFNFWMSIYNWIQLNRENTI